MNSAIKNASALALIVAVMAAFPASASESVKLNDGTTCTIIETTGSIAGATTAKGTSTSVTAGNGNVSSSTTIDGKTTTMQSGGGTSSSAGAAVTTGTAGNQSFSTASVIKPDGSVITRRSDGTCDIAKPQK